MKQRFNPHKTLSGALREQSRLSVWFQNIRVERKIYFIHKNKVETEMNINLRKK